MAKIKAPSVLQVINNVSKENTLPVYYLFGEDTFNLNTGLTAIEEAVNPFISSDFDRETFYGEDKPLKEILNFATAFPFGNGKKLIILKQFEKVKDKKLLKDYVLNPADFTVLVIVHYGTINNLATELYKTLLSKNYLFEAKELKGKSLLDWIISSVKIKGKYISEENAQVLIDIVGENRSMVAAQLDKIFTYISGQKEITLESIHKVSSELKKYDIFNLQDAVGERDKTKAMEIAFNLLDNGFDSVFIVNMLTRYFTGLSKVTELRKNKVPDNAAAKIVRTHPFYYKKYIQARKLYSDTKLIEVFRALLKADVSIKTTSADSKTIISVLISEILK